MKEGSKRLYSVSREFDYKDKTFHSKGKLWFESYEPELELYADMLAHRNTSIIELTQGGHRLLDIGCGFGDLLYLLRGKYDILCGIDPSSDMVHQTTWNLQHRNVQNDFYVTQGVAEELKFENDYFDTVLLIDTYEHIHPEYRSKALAEIKRVLKPGHALIVVTPSAWAMRAYAVLDNLLMLPIEMLKRNRIVIFSLTKKSYTEVFCTKGRLMADLWNAGFQIQGFKRVSFYPAPERPGFFGLFLHRIYGHPKCYGILKFLFHKLKRLSIFNQKMLLRCTIDR